MISRRALKALAVQTIAFFVLATVLNDYAWAQRGGRGDDGRGRGARSDGSRGSISRSGPASGGGFTSRPQTGARPGRPGEWTRPARPGRPGGPGRPGRPGAVHRPRPAPHHPRWDHRRHWDHWDRWDRRYDDWRRRRRSAAIGAGIVAGVLAIGAILTASQWGSLGCTPEPVIFGGITYYRCGPNWYERVYAGGGEFTYIVVTPPPGY